MNALTSPSTAGLRAGYGRTAAIAALAAVTVGCTAGMANAATPPPTASSAAAAVKRSAPMAVEDTRPVIGRRTSTTAIVATPSGASVSVPADPTKPATLSAPGSPAIGISMGVAAGAGAATAINDAATVVYPGTEVSTSTVAQASRSGAIRYLKVLAGTGAPSDYRFRLSLPTGGKLVGIANSRYVIETTNNWPIDLVDAPRATDANGRVLPASYSAEGSTLVMHVDQRGAAYPIVAASRFRIPEGLPATWKTVKDWTGKCLVVCPAIQQLWDWAWDKLKPKPAEQPPPPPPPPPAASAPAPAPTPADDSGDYPDDFIFGDDFDDYADAGGSSGSGGGGGGSYDPFTHELE